MTAPCITIGPASVSGITKCTVAPEIFTPFVTGKPDGLGLGLGIARDIMREFGGMLDTIPSSLGGAGFIIRLRRA